MNSAGGQAQQNPAPAGGEKPNNSDFPPFSRVFVVCSRNHKEEDIRAAFQSFGTLEDVWMVKDRMTKENKGICYVKFDKASTAAIAIEALDGKTIGNEPKPIKVGVVSCVFLLQSSTLSKASDPACVRVHVCVFNDIFRVLKV